jgi:hypothetical protein
VAFAFDTLSFAHFLRQHGVSQEHAEAHAEAARQFIMTELTTKQDLLLLRQDLQANSMQFETKLTHLSAHFDTKLDNLSLRLTVRLGIMLAAGVAAIATLVKLG